MPRAAISSALTHMPHSLRITLRSVLSAWKRWTPTMSAALLKQKRKALWGLRLRRSFLPPLALENRRFAQEAGAAMWTRSRSALFGGRCLTGSACSTRSFFEARITTSTPASLKAEERSISQKPFIRPIFAEIRCLNSSSRASKTETYSSERLYATPGRCGCGT